MEPTSDHRKHGAEAGVIPNPEPTGPVGSIHNPLDDTSFAASESLESLDDELARLADDMVDGEFLSTNPVESASDATGEAVYAGASPASTDGRAKGGGKTEESATTQSPSHVITDAPTHAATPTDNPPLPSSPAPATAAALDNKPADPTPIAPTDVVAEVKPGVVTVCVNKAVDALCRPFDGKPAWFRQTVVIAGALQIALAGLVWGHMLFFRSPDAPIPTISEVDLRERSPATDSHAKSDHGKSKSSDHGKSASKSKTSDHGKSTSHGKSDSHGKGGH